MGDMIPEQQFTFDPKLKTEYPLLYNRYQEVFLNSSNILECFVKICGRSMINTNNKWTYRRLWIFIEKNEHLHDLWLL